MAEPGLAANGEYGESGCDGTGDSRGRLFGGSEYADWPSVGVGERCGAGNVIAAICWCCGCAIAAGSSFGERKKQSKQRGKGAKSRRSFLVCLVVAPWEGEGYGGPKRSRHAAKGSNGFF